MPIHSLRTKPGAFANLIYRDALFPRAEYGRCWDALAATLPLRRACQIIVGLLWLAHDQACEADLAAELDRILGSGDLPDPETLRARFMQAPQDSGPDIPVHTQGSLSIAIVGEPKVNFVDTHPCGALALARMAKI